MVRSHRSLARLAPLLALFGLLPLLACESPRELPGREDGGTEGSSAIDDARTAPVQEAGPVAFVGVSVIPMDGERVLEDRTVLVEGGRIARIGETDAVDVPEDALVVEGEGRFLLPGLAEMHAHVPPEGGRAWMERVLVLYLAHGLTTVRGMLGTPEHLELRDELERGTVLGPRLYTSGPSLNGNSIPDPDSGRAAVRHQAEAGYDFLKIHPGLTRAEYDAIAEEADEAGIRWAGHVPADVGLERALEAGQASVDHLDGYVEAATPEGAEPDLEPLFFGVQLTDVVDEDRLTELAAATREAGVWNVPTQTLIERVLLPGDPEAMAEEPQMRYMPPDMVSGWVDAKRRIQGHGTWEPERVRRFVELRRDLIVALHEAEAPLLLGSDAPQIFQVPGFSALEELEVMVEAGLTPYQALETGTRNVAVYFDDLDEYGTVEEGKVADLVLLEADPLADISAVHRQAGVMTRGRWLPAEEIRQRLEEIAADPAP